MSTEVAFVFVNSNQSAATGLLPLDHGATSVINIFPMVPGEPTSVVLFKAANASLTPTALNVLIAVLFKPIALLKE